MNPEITPRRDVWHWHWLTIKEFAREMNRSERQILNWTQNGTLAAFGLPVYRINKGKYHSRFFILMKP